MIILSDLELGAGNLTDDFISDNLLCNLINELNKKNHKIDLIFNGDTFDFLKCPYLKDEDISYPRYVTEEISLEKLKLIANQHKFFFKTLEKFAKNNNIYFIYGNHDADLVFPKIKKQIKSLINNNKNVHFPGFVLEKDGVHIEHGHQYDLLNRANPEKLFINYNGKKILNMPWISYGVIEDFLKLKEKHPFLERIFPRITLMRVHKPIGKTVTKKLATLFGKSLIYYSWRRFSNPTYQFPKEIIKEASKNFKKLKFDLDFIVPIFKDRMKDNIQDNKIYVFGHVHKKYVEEENGITILIPGSWRDEYDLNVKDRTLIPRNKRYIQIIIDGNKLDYKFHEVKSKQKELLFNDIIKDEVEAVLNAAKNENYKVNFL